ncbi:hypothetical protein NQ314_005337 [Rhamnusium bicolor]|uniref:WASH complex subunit 3 n=1 Tax=Rhamnusium bicolor TaxID=1586634 RepID=A0AAV8ZK18_9CUCU|nr:hypothetical protein NQ314_005337 [Rhamnusium bicolor]
MQVDELPAVDPNVDLTQILPIQQKRTIAFVNHFIMKTVSYLNNFAQSCESRFMEFEYKIQKIEAALLILESQLSSISGLDNLENSTPNNEISADTTANISKLDLPDIEVSNEIGLEKITADNIPQTEQDGVKACDDPRFKKFFKMLQFGVPQPAVKLKMQNEGLDPNILDKPNDAVPSLSQDSLKHSTSNSDSISESD